jgi:hypothetical protein
MSSLPHDLPDPTVLLKYAPQVRFSKYERYFPCTLAFLLQNATLKDQNNPSWQVSQPTPAQLAQYNGANYYLSIAEAAHVGIPPVNGNITVPMIVSVQYYDQLFIDINYIFLFAYQGPAVAYVSTVGTFFCLVPKYGEHQADVERVIVRVTPDWSTILAVGFDAHGHTNMVSEDEVAFSSNGNPRVNAALNGHASYDFNEVGSNDWEAEADFTVLDLGVQIGAYVDGAGPVWQPQTVNDIVLVGINNGTPINDNSWVLFGGKLGATTTNSFTTPRQLDRTALPTSQLAQAVSIGKSAEWTGAIGKNYTIGDPPDGLGARKYVLFTPTVVYSQIVLDTDKNYVLSADPNNPMGQLVVMPSDIGDDHQLWYVDRWGPGWFVLWNKATVLVASVDVQNFTTAVIQIESPNRRGGVWALLGDEQDGYYGMSSLNGNAGSITVQGSPAPRTPVTYLAFGATNTSQRWGIGRGQQFYEQITTQYGYALSVDLTNPTGPLVLRQPNPNLAEQLWLRGPGVPFTLRNKHTGQYLRANGSDTLVTQVATPDGQCTWNLGGDEGDDTHAVRPSYDTSQNLDVRGGNPADGVQIDTYKWKNAAWQKWSLMPIEMAHQPPASPAAAPGPAVPAGR